MMLAAIDWTNVLVALIAGMPAIIAAVFAGMVHGQIKTPSGDSIGHVIERAHETAIANNLLLSKANGETRAATKDELHAAEPTSPQIPVEPPTP